MTSRRRTHGDRAAKQAHRLPIDDDLSPTSRAAMRAALEQRHPDPRHPDPRIATILRLVAAAYPQRAGAPVDPVELVCWFIEAFQGGRGIDIDLLARASEHDIAEHLISYAYRGREGTC